MKIDNLLTHKIWAIPIFLGVMLLIFWLTFGVIGSFLSDLLSMGIDGLSDLTARGLELWGVNPVVRSLVIDGIFAGVGSVLSFLPLIVVLFFFLSLLEDSGYMARVAFVMDKLLRKNRPVRPKLCADAHRVRMFGAGHPFRQDPVQ